MNRRYFKGLVPFIALLRTALWVPFAVLLPRQRNKIVFGAWWGNNFSDNPKYLMKSLLRRGGFRCIWIGKSHLKDQVLAEKGAEFATAYSFKALWHFFTAKWYVCNIFWDDDIMRIPSCGRATVIDLFHGIPYKNIGRYQLDGDGGGRKIAMVRRGRIHEILVSFIMRFYAWCYQRRSWTSVSSRRMIDIMADAWPGTFSRDRMLYAGMPRMDWLVENRSNASLKQMLKLKYAEIIGIPSDKRWYLYLPTWRNCEASAFSFTETVHKDRLESLLLQQNALIVEKQHPKVLGKMAWELKGENESVKVVSAAKSALIDVQELLLCSDRLITDYSSCFFDFEVLGRPVIHYAYDLDRYEQRDAGVLYDLREIAAGPVVATEHELIRALECTDEGLLASKGPLADEPIEYEKGESASAIVDRLLSRK